MLKTKTKQKGFTIVELLIVIVVIGILAAITIVAYNGIQARANDARTRSAVSQIEKAIQLFYLNTGKPPIGGTTSTGAVVNNTCPGSSFADGFVGKGISACTLENLLISDNQISSTFIPSLPPNKFYGATAGYAFMFYQCGAVANNRYSLYWYLESPSSQDTASRNAVSAECGQGSWLSSSFSMGAGKIIQL